MNILIFYKNEISIFIMRQNIVYKNRLQGKLVK